MPFCEEKAERAVQFIRQLTHTKGEWAGQQFDVLPWQEEFLRPLFGTVMEDGSRQYRVCYVEVPKKNGKSEAAAALALYMLCADGEASPEVYGAASDRDQASLVYGVAAQMVRNNPTLSKILQIRDSRRRIYNPRNGGVYQVLSAEVHTKHGLNPSAVIFDELHAQPNDELWRVLTVGTDYARKQQLVFVCTTAGIYDVESCWWRVREKARQIKEGIIEDPSWLPVLYIADPERDDPADEELWRRVNPSLGRIFTLDRIRRDYEQAKHDLIEFEDFKRFRLNIPAKQVRRWMPMDRWDMCRGEIDLETLRGRPCYGGLDLSTKVDLSALVLVWPPENEADKWVVYAKAYCPEDTIRDRARQDRVPYHKWVQQGFITATPGNVIDYEYIKRDIIQMSNEYDLREIGYDPWNATEIATYLLNNEGIQMVEVRQGARSLSEPSKSILACTLDMSMMHDGNPVLRWCADNLVMVGDANENIRPVKDKSTDRIDLFVALIIAWSRALPNAAEGASAYETGGIFTL